jgi:hypothetical protein
MFRIAPAISIPSCRHFGRTVELVRIGPSTHPLVCFSLEVLVRDLSLCVIGLRNTNSDSAIR